MIGDAAMEQVYLPGKIRDRIQDLMKSRKITQAELATRIGVSESSLSRFISGKTDKPGDENIIRIRSLTSALPHHLHPKNEYPQASRACKYPSFCCRRKRSVRYGDSPFPASAVAKGITH